MTNRFWIESIRYTGENVAETVVRFKPGINIVHGPSDTGKTYLAKTIKYMLAGSTKPFATETGYSVITMVLRTDEGKVKLTRNIGSLRTTVTADHNFGILHDDYAIQPTEGNENELTVSDILLRLLGINERKAVLTNQYGSRKPLTWKTFSDTLHRSESRITSEESIFSTAKYATLSAFLTLFYDQDLSLLPEHDDPADIKIRKDILVPVLDEKLTHVQNQLSLLQDQLLEIGDRDVSQEITTLSKQLEQLNQIQDQTRDALTRITNNIATAEQELAVRSMSARHYDDLASVYIGNIKRLTFVSDAQAAIEGLEPQATCPFCDNPLEEQQETDYRHAAQAEAETIAEDLEELSTVRTSLDQHVSVLQQRLKDLRNEQRKIERQLAQAVLPQISRVRDQIRSLESHQSALTEFKMLETEHEELNEQLGELINPPEPDADFNPVERFPNSFYMEMTRYIRTILTETHYPDAERAFFDPNGFDIKIGAKPKRLHGKGYRAFFNTILVLALRQYIHEHALHKPSIVVLDTPTLGLEHQKSSDGLVTSRDDNGRPKTGLLRNLFDHMADTGNHGQLIILNNTDVTPSTHFDDENATELIFGEHDESDRPGLLIDIREDRPDTTNNEVEQPRLWD